ncbi:AAA family ATPase [Ensifer sp. SSB1]|uniref:AAA family ATPase n=1 Tax=Ensifer sp. SSB1 TaxID=2795385 RepID=UPI0025C07232|nr:AAA family ATPase [Ensifer sp. SSB1]
MLDPAAVTRWIERLRLFFPGLDRFDKPDPDFDAGERDYKLEIATELRSALKRAATEEESADAIHSALVKSNLLPWRAYWPMSPKGDADRERLWPALSDLGRAALGAPEGHAAALEAFVAAWMEAVPKGSPDSARQIAEFLFLHISPDEGTYIRHTVRQDLWLEAVGRKFPTHASMAQTYAEEQRFMRAVRQAFEERGLAPRDMIDVQSALWVVHSYKDNEDGSATSQSLTREAVEAAMDAYDEYRKTGEHGEVFDSFGEPRDYWVRSTRAREGRIYPTKPIIGFVRGKTELNGGWGQRGDAAAQLHNSGFIIVGSDNMPVAPPERHDHLIRDADRIHLCAVNYCLEPARERGAREITIRAGNLAKDMGLQNAIPAICSALGGENLQQIAKVPAPTHTEPNPSSSTTFTYKLAAQVEADPVTEFSRATAQAATNLILYGPPGTGKTYHTAWEAVRLCMGDAVAEGLRGNGKREALMAEYRRLASEGLIEFVTFHQSMSYEEFVEGLRPSTGDDAGDDPEEMQVSTGFRLNPHDGVFKRISERARLDRANDGTASRLDRTARVFKVALGQRQIEDDRIRFGLDQGIIHVGWGGDIDWSEERFDDFNEILSEWRALKDPDATGHDGNIVVTYSFRADMQIGDYVVVSDGRDRIQAFGSISSDYFYDHDAAYHPHRRKVEWIWRDDLGAERSRFYPNAFRRHSVYKLNQALVDWDELEALVFGGEGPIPSSSAREHVLIIDEINRANISKVFGELITLLEPDKRLGMTNEIRLMLPYSKKPFGVPANLHIIGTMNTADRSIALLDTALRRRFTFHELMPDPSVLPADVDGINLQRLLTTINDRIEYLFDREHQIGHAYFTGCETRDCVDEVMRHKVIPLLAEYFYEDWSKVAAVFGDTGQGPARFLEARRLAAPAGLAEADFAGEKLRWRVKDQFDFSEFEA